MVLARAVLRDSGQVLVGEGTELSASLVERLASMGVESITVQGHPVNLEGVGGNTSYARRIERLDHLFRKHQADPWMGRVKAHLEQYFRMKAAAEEAAANSPEEDSGQAAAPANPAAAPAAVPGVASTGTQTAAQVAAPVPAPAKKGGLFARLFKGGGRG